MFFGGFFLLLLAGRGPHSHQIAIKLKVKGKEKELECVNQETKQYYSDFLLEITQLKVTENCPQ